MFRDFTVPKSHHGPDARVTGKFHLLAIASLAIAASVAAASGGETATPSTGRGSVVDLSQNKQPPVLPSDAVDTVREGTHLVNRIGRLSRTTDGQQYIITLDAAGSETTNPKMIVQPNLNLLSMESVLTNRTAQMNFRVSGTVTEYKGLNYILLDSVQTTLARSTPAPTAAPKPAAKNTPAPAADPASPGPARDRVAPPVASAESTMNRLLETPPTAGDELPVTPGVSSARDTSTGKAAVAPDAPVLKVMRDGAHLTDHVGRLNHSPDGKQAILTFDADGKAMQDPPMIILPNMKLSAMEGAVTTFARDVHFRVSGTVTEYKGRNYILLNKAVAIADVESNF